MAGTRREAIFVRWEGESEERRFEGASGQFSLKGLRAGAYALQFDAEGYAAEWLDGLEVGEREKKSAIEVRLRRFAGVRGTVVDADTREPVAGARVSADMTEKTEWGTRSMTSDSASSGAGGEFELADVRPGHAALEVSSRGHVDWRSGVLELEQGEVIEGLLVELERGGAIEGFVFEGDGSPAPRVSVGAERADRWASGSRLGLTSRDGSFRIEDLAPGRYRVTAELPSPEDEDPYTGAPRELKAIAVVERGTTARVELRARAGGCTVRGRVFRRREPVTRAHVSLKTRIPGEEEFSPSNSRRPIPCMTSEDGSYAIREVPAGQATMWVGQVPNTLHPFPVTIPEAGEFVFDVHLPGGAIAGRVVRASDGSPVHGAELSASRVHGGSRDHAGSTRTDEAGRYRIEDLSPGAYSLCVDPAPEEPDERSLADDLGPETRSPVSVEGDGAVVADFSLQAAGRALVIVRDASGRPVSDAIVSLRPVGGSDVFDRKGGQSPSAVHRGEYLIVGVPPGRYFAHVLVQDSWENGWSEEGSVARGEQSEFHVQLRRGTRVDVRLVVQDRSAPVVAVLWFQDEKKRIAVYWSSVHQILAGGNENSRRTFLPAGRWTLHVSADGYREKSVPVVVEEGVPQEIAVPLEPEGSPR